MQAWAAHSARNVLPRQLREQRGETDRNAKKFKLIHYLKMRAHNKALERGDYPSGSNALPLNMQSDL